MRQAVIDRIEQFMTTRQWDHNQHYHRWILRNAPRSIPNALDVGCGTGDLARLLASRARHVEAIDSDSHMIQQTIRATPSGTPVHYRHESLMNARGAYTLITAVAVLHHLELAPACAAGVEPSHPAEPCSSSAATARPPLPTTSLTSQRSRPTWQWV